MRRFRRRKREKTRLREAVLVGGSVIVALALGWAGWLVGNAPDKLAEAEVASTARLVARDLETQWETLRNGDAFRTFSDGSLESMWERAASGLAGPVQRQPVLLDDPKNPRAFVALFLEAERLARAGEIQEASDVLAEALTTGTVESDAPALRLLELRLALGAAPGSTPEPKDEPKGGSASNAWDRMVSEVSWSDTRDGRPVRLVAAWLAADRLDGARALELRESLTGVGARFIIGDGSPLDRVVRTKTGLTLEVDSETAATLGLCESLWPGIGEALRATPAWASRAMDTVARELEPVASAAATVSWAFASTPVGLSAIRAGEPPFLVDEAALAERLRSQLPLPPGFFVALEGETGDFGSPLLDPVNLDGRGPSVQLHHSDPARLIRDGARRRRYSAWLLVTLGLVCVGAALVAARSLRRERRLTELRSAFVAGISHDLRTPLASILLMAENLGSGRVGPERTVEYASGISSEAERLRRRVDDVLDFARIERGEPTRAVREEIDLPELVEDIVRFSRELAEASGLAFEAEVAELPASAELDADALRRIVGNLVENALRHSEGTRIGVTFSAEKGALVATVEDDGAGIPAKDRQRVLAPFEQLDRDVNPKGGTGLGLAIVAGLVKALDGTLAIEDGLDGAGVRFLVSLPLHSPTAP